MPDPTKTAEQIRRDRLVTLRELARDSTRRLRDRRSELLVLAEAEGNGALDARPLSRTEQELIGQALIFAYSLLTTFHLTAEAPGR